MSNITMALLAFLGIVLLAFNGVVMLTEFVFNKFSPGEESFKKNRTKRLVLMGIGALMLAIIIAYDWYWFGW